MVMHILPDAMGQHLARNLTAVLLQLWRRALCRSYPGLRSVWHLARNSRAYFCHVPTLLHCGQHGCSDVGGMQADRWQIKLALHDKGSSWSIVPAWLFR